MHWHGISFRLLIGYMLEPSLRYIYICILFCGRIFLTDGLQKSRRLKQRGSSTSHTPCVPALTSGDVHHT